MVDAESCRPACQPYGMPDGTGRDRCRMERRTDQDVGVEDKSHVSRTVSTAPRAFPRSAHWRLPPRRARPSPSADRRPATCRNSAYSRDDTIVGHILAVVAQHHALALRCFQHAVERGLCFLDRHGAHGGAVYRKCRRHRPLIRAFDLVLGELHEAVAEVEAVGLAAVQDFEAIGRPERIGFGEQDLQDRRCRGRVVMAAVEIERVELDLRRRRRGSRRSRSSSSSTRIRRMPGSSKCSRKMRRARSGS